MHGYAILSTLKKINKKPKFGFLRLHSIRGHDFVTGLFPEQKRHYFFAHQINNNKNSLKSSTSESLTKKKASYCEKIKTHSQVRDSLNERDAPTRATLLHNVYGHRYLVC